MKKTCEECHGTGENCYFKGESRFLLSREECPACCGLGFIETDEPEANDASADGDAQTQ